MIKKYGKWYADWEDTGRRFRKVFPTRKGAMKYQAKMRAVYGWR